MFLPGWTTTRSTSGADDLKRTTSLPVLVIRRPSGGAKVEATTPSMGSVTAREAAIDGYGVAINERLVVQDRGRGSAQSHALAGLEAADL